MIFGAHLVLFSTDADADRTFLAEQIGLESVDGGDGWLIFALPPTEAAVHPAQSAGAQLYLMCDDLGAEMAVLEDRGVTCSAIEEAPWGLVTTVRLPSGGALGLYEPRRPSALERPGGPLRAAGSPLTGGT